MLSLLLLTQNFGFDDDDGCCDGSSDEDAVYMARRRRTVRCGARTRTDRVGRYMLVYDCRRAGVVPARTTLARAPTTPFYSPRRPTTTGLDSGATVDSNHQETFSLFLLFLYNFFFVLTPQPPRVVLSPPPFCNPPTNSCTRTHTRARTAYIPTRVIVHERDTRTHGRNNES